MSNEELAAEIQAGHTERTGELWAQIENLVRWKANRVTAALEGRGNVEFDDLVQSGYLAMVKAVETYRPESGAFVTWFMFYLKSEFAAAAGYRTVAGRKDPANTARSLDEPLKGGDGEETPLGDIVPDPMAWAAMETVENAIENQQLREALETALDTIPESLSLVLRMRYFDGMTLEEAAEAQHVGREAIRQREAKGLRQLRRPKVLGKLFPFMEFDYYKGTGLNSFRYSGASVQERYLLFEEKHRERAAQRQKKAECDLVAEAKAAADERIAHMTQEEKIALLKKYGCL